MPMENNYKINDLSSLGLRFVEVYGDTFSYKDLYGLVGLQQFITTFNFRKGTEAQAKFGENVTGVIYYDRKSLLTLQESSTPNDGAEFTTIKINSPAHSLSLENLNDLKYGGVKISDIESISFLSYSRETKIYDTGEKKVTNIVEVPVDYQGIDVDVLRQNYLIKKNNDGVELIDYEKEQLIGITLAINEGKIDSRILKHFGFDAKSAGANMNIWYHRYKVKERRKTLSDEEKKKLFEIEGIQNTDKFIKLMKEIIANSIDEKEFKSAKDIFKEIMDSISSFSPNILLHGKKQVYWDTDSYIHIVMRHIKSYQFGASKSKSALPYKVQDLETLIEQVLRCVKEEYKLHCSENPESNFTRQGRMAVVYNGDHYNLRIDPKGRLIQFHTVG